MTKNNGGRSDEHEFLKSVGRKILVNMGCLAKNIKEEHHLFIKTIKKKYIADLYCDFPWTENLGIIVECGNINAEKLMNLRNAGFLVICLPYSMLKDFSVEKMVDKTFKEIDKSLRSNVAHIRDVYGDIDQKIRYLKEEIKDIDIFKTKKIKDLDRIYSERFSALDDKVRVNLYHYKEFF